MKVITPHAQREWGKLLVLVSIYIFFIFFGTNILNRTEAIDSPFQTFAVGLLVKL